MSLYDGLNKKNHLSEFGEALDTDQGFLSAAARRLLALQNLTGDSDIVLADITKLAAVTADAAELNIMDGVTATTAEINTLDLTGTVGTAGTGATATENGNTISHVTKLVLSGFSVGTSGDNAALALGALLYTFPAGDIMVRGVIFDAITFTAAMTPTTDTPEYGLGSTQASGVQATLGAVAATAEDTAGPFVAADVGGTANSETGFPYAGTRPRFIAAAAAHTIYLNMADTWADVDAAAAVVAAGDIYIVWDRLTTS